MMSSPEEKWHRAHAENWSKLGIILNSFVHYPKTS